MRCFFFFFWLLVFLAFGSLWEGEGQQLKFFMRVEEVRNEGKKTTTTGEKRSKCEAKTTERNVYVMQKQPYISTNRTTTTTNS